MTSLARVARVARVAHVARVSSPSFRPASRLVSQTAAPRPPSRLTRDDLEDSSPPPRRPARYPRSRPAPSRSRKPSPRPAAAAAPRQFVLPDVGLSARQLSALADVHEARVLAAARALDDRIAGAEAVLAPALVELVAEELRLPLHFRPQTVPLLEGRGKKNGAGEVRMPVVTVMGHVDHGKTSLLDALRESDVAGSEAGGITQSVAAFAVDMGQGVGGATFIDTPGHAAFKAMRANGTVGTDVVVLVVAADDGVMPQTEEAVRLARAADVPVVVAINKCDRPGADAERVRFQLLEKLQLNTEALGGEVQCVEISAKTRHNLPQLLDAIALQAEMLNLRADAHAAAGGVCLESRVDRAWGSVATVVVREGTLRRGNEVVFQSPRAMRGDLFGRVRTLLEGGGGVLEEAGPGMAVGVVGVKETIPPGVQFVVVGNEKMARARSQKIIARNLEAVMTIEEANRAVAERMAKEAKEAEKGEEAAAAAVKSRGEEEDVVEEAGEERVRSIVVLVKGDVKGSADAVAQCVQALSTGRYPVRILDAGVGDVTELDVRIASAAHKVKGNRDEAMIVAFNVKVKEAEMRRARNANVSVLTHKIIYHLEDELKERIEKIHEEETAVEESLGKAGVVRVFEEGKIAGCSVERGDMTVGERAKVWRYPDATTGETEREVVFEGVVESIKHFKKDARTVSKGTECGISFGEWHSFAAGDVIECVRSRKGGGAA